MLRIPREKTVTLMSLDNPPAARSKPGETVVFEVPDAFGGQITGEDVYFSTIGWDRVNPAVGPLFVENALPGDCLKVEILEIKLDESAVMVAGPGFGVLGDIYAEEKTRILPIRDGRVIFNDMISLKVKPMVGVIGVAPAGESVPTGSPGPHGGNMDCKRVTEGAVLYLPVNVEGALLAMGDMHAAMGDGEIVVCGAETGGEITVRVSVLQNFSAALPIISEGGRVITVASAETLDEAARAATRNMYEFLYGYVKIESYDAGMLMSAAGDLRICQVVDPLMTARFEFPMSILEKYGCRLP